MPGGVFFPASWLRERRVDVDVAQIGPDMFQPLDLSFNLFFEQSANAFRALSFSRAALFEVGLTQAAEWELIPLYSDGQEFDPADYAAARQSEAEGNLWLSVEAKASKRLHGVRVSTYRHPRQLSDIRMVKNSSEPLKRQLASA